MRVQLFIPCYIDQFYPQVGIASLQILQKLGCTVEFPLSQTCCGQPMANAGYNHVTRAVSNLFVENFSQADYIICPSGSCALHIKEHLNADDPQKTGLIQNKVYELTEFITDILKVERIEAEFAHKVGYHSSCHGQRGLHLSSMSEIGSDHFSKPARLLNSIRGLELVYPKRVDECCGFGGTF
jgi:L-lactate dehydrogenase complex protein LldE